MKNYKVAIAKPSVRLSAKMAEIFKMVGITRKVHQE